MYNTSFLREQEEKRKYKGRGKYKRNPNQYFADYYKKNEKVQGDIAFGWSDLTRQRSRAKKRLHGGYRVKIYNNTKKTWIKR